MKAVAALIVLTLIAPAMAQIDPTATPPTPAVPDVTQNSATGQGTGSVDPTSTSGNAAGSATGSLANGTAQGSAGTQQSFDVDATYETRWHFDLPLRGQDIALRAPNGSHRDQLTVTVEWTSGNQSKDYPANATLHLRGPIDHAFAASHQAGSTATFTIPAGLLYLGAETAWRPAIRTAGSPAFWSPYEADGTSLATMTTDNVHAGKSGDRIIARDGDTDGHPDDLDNCPRTNNPDQANMDGDLDGDACDKDIDGDGHSNTAEAAAPSDPRDPKSTPLDRDGDGYNNTQETDARSDPDNAASTPLDPDADGHPTHVEESAGSNPYDPRSTPHDLDADGLENGIDNCPRQANGQQQDVDGDGIGDACDPNATDGPLGDQDEDGVQNSIDNCRLHHNPDQANMDGDLMGDLCDVDIDGDGHVNWADAFRFDVTEWNDNDADGIGDNRDDDDDNDGLTDIAEMNLRTDPLKADTDGDRYSDFEELAMATSPLDHHDPAYLPTDARAIGLDDGTVRIEWSNTGDARIGQYVVWDRADRRIVAMLQPDADQVIDRMPARNNTLYAIQAVFVGEVFAFDASRAAEAYIFKSDVVAWQSQAAGDAPAEAEPAGTPPLVREKDTPGLAWVPIGMLLVGIALWRRR